jgi:hypothetical protein
MVKIFNILHIIKITHILINISNAFSNSNSKYHLSSNNKLVETKHISSKYNNIKDQCLIDKKLNNEICNIDTELYIENHNDIKNKKLIAISPAGLRGFYLLGILSYIKNNYDTSNYIFTGASAGAFNALFATYKYDPNNIVNILDIENIFSYDKCSFSISKLQQNIKNALLNNFSTNDFELDKLYIGVTSIKNFHSKTNIYHHFENLEDAIDACIASSNIPFITGNIIHKYNNLYSFDGGFSKYPFLHLFEPTLHITSDIWENIDGDSNKKDTGSLLKIISNFIQFFFTSSNDFIQLYKKGYNDTEKNKNYLDGIL